MDSWITDMIQTGGYGGILLLMFLENIFPPIPSELIMPLAGYTASLDQLNFIGVVIAGTLGSLVGAVPLYYIGYAVGEERLKRFADRHGHWLALSRRNIDTADRWFDRHGRKTVFFCRLIPGIRSLISIPAGMSGMPLLPFLVYTALGSLLWTAFLAYLGFVLGSNFEQVGDYLGPVSKVVLGAVVILYVVHVVRHKMKQSHN